ncbi:hypothetical protein HZH66_007596 [Vespula vulgaris]|uniref:Uncharacterized protein n=1 Tax=Vespula vulgaris TaxID=7454 RepID=A0A834K164_VESVU|nr:hypothetical protein HZH66_007596 [Vespula vulgaris]
MAFGSEKNKVRINPRRVGAVKGIRVRPGTRMRVLHESKVSRFIVSWLRDDQLQNCNDQSHCRGGSLYKNVPSTFFRCIAKGLNAILERTDSKVQFSSPSAGKFGLARQAEVRANKDVGKNQRLILRPILARRFVRRTRQDLQAHALENPFEWRPVDEPSSFSAIGLFPLPYRVVVTHFVPQANRVPRFV